MLEINRLILRDDPIHLETFRALAQCPVDEWSPITVEGRRVTDGVQRVLAARQLGYDKIPGRKL